MYDFCATIPYGGLLVLGGLISLLNSQSFTLAIGCTLFGAGLGAIGWSSFQEFSDNKNATDKKYRSPTYAYVVVSFVVTLLVTFMVSKEYFGVSEAAFPLGFLFYLSLVMIVFYVYKLAVSGDVGSTAERAYKRND